MNKCKFLKSKIRLLNKTIVGLFFFFVLVEKAVSQVNTPPPSTTSSIPSDDKIDVGNLEQKYWSAKDDDFTVVQNRTYTKNKRFFISMMTGRIINDGFIEGSPNSFALGYFFNEKNGLSLDQTQFVTHDNSVTKQFISRYGVAPAYNKPLTTTSLTYMWSPIYAKVSILERKILYLDMSIGFHVGITHYQSMTVDGGQRATTQHYGVDLNQLWFLNKNFALRFDIRNTWSKQKQLLYHIRNTEPESLRSLGSTQLQDNTWLIGLNFFFGK